MPPPPPIGSDEGAPRPPPPFDGRDSPEPSTSNTGEGLCASKKKTLENLRMEVNCLVFENFTARLISCLYLSCIEPTTSRASLNFQEYVLSRPPLSRSHLHFPPLDASPLNMGTSNSLFSQPSTSSAPGPFITGFSLVKEIKDNLSQHEDDNISTTSGFSSRASDKGNVEKSVVFI